MIIIGKFGVHPLKVYSNGLDLPYRGLIEIIKGTTNFVPFKQIEAVYLNERKFKSKEEIARLVKTTHTTVGRRATMYWLYIIVRRKINSRWKTEFIDKLAIANLDEFIKALRGRVKIIEDKCWVLGKGERGI